MTNFKQEIKKSLAKGEPEKAIDELLENSETIGKEFVNEVIILSGELQKWNKEFRLGFEPPKSIINRINFALLEIIDKIETTEDIVNTKLQKVINYTCLYNSKEDKTNGEWTLFNTNGLGNNADSILINQNDDVGKLFEIKAFNEEFVGIEKPINRLFGFVELEYFALNSQIEDSENLMFIMIPMKHNSLNQTGYIEVGSNVQDSPQNPFSPYRKRFIIPREHIGDNKWHNVIIEFDFRYINDAFYTIFAPRINEGALIKGGGEFKFKNLKIFG